MKTADALVRLLHLASPALPIGGYSYSQGLEWAVESGAVSDATSASRWIGDLLHAFAQADAAVCARGVVALRSGDLEGFIGWNAWFRASRETAELRAETLQMGAALMSLARDLGWIDGDDVHVARAGALTLPAAFALAAWKVDADAREVVATYLFAWLENQVLAAIKLVPLGQVAGQRMLLQLSRRIAAAAGHAVALDDEDVSSFAPGQALASARHETQYSRLFRS